jgi:CheY-like chemotaxis protein
VEDHHDTRDMYAHYFQHASWIVESVANGEEAFAVAAAFLPDVIVMDLCMPVLNGIDTTRRLKSDARTSAITVVALSANLAPMGEALTAGCAMFVARPCIPAELLSKLENIIRDRPHAATTRGRRG